MRRRVRPLLRGALPIVLTAVVVVTGVAALVVRPATGATQGTADYVVVAGVAGLRWDDVDPQTTPTLWAMAERGSIGSLAVRSARKPTCPVDGWLTLGAGSYAAWDSNVVTGDCQSVDVTVDQPDGIGAYLPDQRNAVRYNQDKLPWGAMPGALAESMRCTVAVGPGAAIAAARPFGRVDRYEPTLPEQPRDLLASCVLSIVDLGTVSGEDPAARAAAAAAADAELARIVAARPDRSLVFVAGLSDTDQTARLHVAVADGPGWQAGWLTSASTQRDGYLQLVDIAPTVVSVLGRPMPERLFVGHPASVVAGRPTDLPVAVGQPADADREAGAQRNVADWFFGLLTVLQVLLAIAVVPVLRRARPSAGPPGPTPVPARVVTAVEVLLVAAALAIPAALVGDIVPWWRWPYSGLVFASVMVAALGVATAAVRLSRIYPRTLAPMGLVAALAALVVGVDVLTGARLQLNGVAGYSALEGGRYAGMSVVGLGVFVAGILLVAGCLAQQVRRAWRPAVMVAVGGIGVVVVGSPYLGADPVGAVALTAGVSVAAAMSTGGWLNLPRLAWATIAGLAVTTGFAVIDLRRPVEDRGSLGRFLAALGDGTSGMTVQRTSAANMDALMGSALTVIALVSAVLVWFALLRTWGGLKRLFGIYPAVRAAMGGIVTATVIGGMMGGSAFNVAGAAAAVTVPMAALAAIRVLGHSADRTRPPVLPMIEQPPLAAAVAGPAVAAGVIAAEPARDPVPVEQAEDPAPVGEPAAGPAEGAAAGGPPAATSDVPVASP